MSTMAFRSRTINEKALTNFPAPQVNKQNKANLTFQFAIWKLRSTWTIWLRIQLNSSERLPTSNFAVSTYSYSGTAKAI